MDPVRDTSQYHPKLSLIIFKVKVIQCHFPGQGKVKLKILCLGGVCMFLGQVSLRTRKMTPEDLFNGPNPTKFENRKNAEILENTVKMAVFDLQNTKTRPFFKISTQIFVHLYTYQGSFTYIPVFRKFEKLFGFFNNIFHGLFFQIFRIFKKLKIRYINSINTFILNLLLKSDRFYL